MAPTACVTMAAPVVLRPTASRPRSFTLSASARPVRGALAPAARLRFTPMRAPTLRISASVSHPNQEGEDLGEGFSASMRVPSTGMANIGTQLGGGGGAAVMEKQGLSLSQSEVVSKAKVDDTGGGGNNGKNINNGGGGDGDDGDDDDYFDDDDEEGEDDNSMFSRRRGQIPECFDRITIEAVLAEWYKTLYSLPSGLRMAVEMGLVSSAQLVRFISVDARPSLVRAVSRHTPAAFSRGFVGRLMGDPGILLKLAYEQAMTLGLASFYEVQQRGDRLKSEVDLAAVNVIAAMATNAAMVWLLCPNRTFGAPSKYGWQNSLAALPCNAFDRSGPQRQYTNVSRGVGAVYKAAQLGAVGLGVGAVSGGVTSALVGMRQGVSAQTQALAVAPERAAMGYAAYAGTTGNLRYQLLNGLDRYLLSTFNSLPLTLGVSALVRFGGQEVGEQTRLHWLGLPKEAPKRRKVTAVKVVRKVKKVKKVTKSELAALEQQAAAASQADAFTVSASVPRR